MVSLNFTSEVENDLENVKRSIKILHRCVSLTKENSNIIMAQRSAFIDSENEYLCIAIARSMYPSPNANSSVTLGLLVNDKLKKKIAFLKDPKIITKSVNATCERCILTDCKERVAEASVVRNMNKDAAIEEEINQLLN